ncbi:MAG: diguanylate cyclase domain-containing protein [Acidimicrobiales bacterium]
MSDPPTSPSRSTFDLEAVVDHAPRPIMLLDSQGDVMWANRAAGDLSGLSPSAIVGHNILEFIVDDDVALVLESIEYLLDRPGRFRPMEFRYRRADGSTGVVEAVSSNQLRDETVNGIVVQVHDVTERRIIDQILESVASGATFATTMRLVARLVEEQLAGTRAIIGVDPVDGRFRTAISVFDLVDELAGSEAFGEATEADEPARPGEPGPPEAPWARAIRTRTMVIASSLDEIPPGLREEALKQGFEACWVVPIVSPGSGEVEGGLIAWRANPGPPSPGERVVAERAGRLVALALERRRSHELLSHAARHDNLTQLPNRAQFLQRLSRELRRSGRLVSLLYLDLDGFKSVNDRYGHRAGDEVLISVAKRIEATLRPDDLTARLGGDEFGVICCHLHAPEEAITIAERLVESLAEPIALPHDVIRSPEMAALAGAPVVDDLDDDDALIEVVIGVTIGIAFGSEVGTDHERLVELADAAMYQGKRAGRGVWRLSADLGKL